MRFHLMTLAPRRCRDSQSPCRTVFPPFIAVFDRLFGEDESKVASQSITWQFLPFLSPFKNGENGENGAVPKRRRDSLRFILRWCVTRFLESATMGRQDSRLAFHNIAAQ
jgi:hypothetical protein